LQSTFNGDTDEMADTTIAGDPQYHYWKPEPLVRGTFSILSSSLLTMILCVWTAVHLNIPEHNKANAQMWRKLGWMITALFAPEYVTCITSWYTGKMLTEVRSSLSFIASTSTQ
jgi:hypothetical protein